jgi:FlaA1/EpsC-like NDP-sugar epimerase
MKRKSRFGNRYLLLGDLAFIVISVLGSYVLRLELGPTLSFYLPSAYWMMVVALILKPIIYYSFGLYRRMWIYASTQELKLIVTAVTAAEVPVALAMLGLWSIDAFVGFPRAVSVIDWALSILMVGGLRMAVRMIAESQRNSKPYNELARLKRVLIVGAGDAGALVVRELQKNPQLNLIPVGFLDDDPAKQKQQLYGIPVVGKVNDLARVLDWHKADEVVIAIPSAPGRIVRLVADVSRLKGIQFRTMPGLYELLGGKVSVSRLREVDITDLLRREPARIRDEEIGKTLRGRTILVTGAGGSIGSELCRQVARWEPAELILLGHGENSIFETWMELKESFPDLPVRPVIADVRDSRRIRFIFDLYRPQVVFHAAAHKHVPLMELNVEDAVTNNILGTRNVVQAALDYNVQRLVMISTDKAIRPANVMGATKRIAESIVLDAANGSPGGNHSNNGSRRAFSVVRFGNVLGSRGSVVPLFKRQIARGGPVTITHPDMKRFFMTIPEAVYLVLQASSMGSGGETFVLNMGEQVRILDLAEDLIRLSGLEPGRDIEVVFTGIRPGEKLSEELWDEGASLQPTAHPDISRLDCVEEVSLTGTELAKSVNELLHLAQQEETHALITLLDELIPGSAVHLAPPPEITAID